MVVLIEDASGGTRNRCVHAGLDATLLTRVGYISKGQTNYPVLFEARHLPASVRPRISIFPGLLTIVKMKLDKRQIVEACYLDSNKAHDMVKHRLLMHKIQSFGIRGSTLNWVSDFLTGSSFYAL